MEPLAFGNSDTTGKTRTRFVSAEPLQETELQVGSLAE